MQNTMSRCWTVAYVGLGIFWSVVAMQQFGTAWPQLSDGRKSDHGAVY
jgi:hypothetical protein